jgi:hypothetical protein
MNENNVGTKRIFNASDVAFIIGELLAKDEITFSCLDEHPADFWEEGLKGEGVVLRLNGKAFKVTVEEININKNLEKNS